MTDYELRMSILNSIMLLCGQNSINCLCNNLTYFLVYDVCGILNQIWSLSDREFESCRFLPPGWGLFFINGVWEIRQEDFSIANAGPRYDF